MLLPYGFSFVCRFARQGSITISCFTIRPTHHVVCTATKSYAVIFTLWNMTTPYQPVTCYLFRVANHWYQLRNVTHVLRARWGGLNFGTNLSYQVVQNLAQILMYLDRQIFWRRASKISEPIL